jgi:hypothetical protein
MALHQRKRMPRVGLPEFVAALLIGLAAYSGVNCWRTRGQVGWAKAPGRTVECKIRLTHYNAERSDPKVTLDYEYDVFGTTYTGHWTGYWPSDYSPNALPQEQLGVLCNKGYILVVMYDPRDPSQSRLHDSDPGPVVASTLLAFAGAGLLVFYCVKVYPAWKSRHQHRHG